jgi:DNA-binding SARP family transcriptional activator
MADKQLRIYLFGNFHISDGTNIFSGASDKKNKIWSVLKYLIAYCGKPVSAERLACILWPDEDCADPAKLLRDVIYRLRKALTAYGGEKTWIFYSCGNYFWSPDIHCWIDVLEFDRLLCRARDASKPYEERTELYSSALEFYTGPFLSNSEAEVWALPFTNFYRRLFLQAIGELAGLYEAKGMFEDIVRICDNAIMREPYEESLYVRQIQTLIQTGEYAYARQQYRMIEKILMQEFDTGPSPELEHLSSKIDQATVDRIDGIGEIAQMLEERSKKPKAFFCSTETFQQIYSLDKRSNERIRFPVHLGLLTLTMRSGLHEKEGEMKEAIAVLRQILMESLRTGDIVSQYSRCQLILMITTLSRENGIAALRRIKFLFESRFKTNRINIEYNISPVGNEDT